eukprot:TRINITY_DN8382_c0_g1_i1.p1 TRINITY_DN8382_c0_g1~~TRINITY_DN8382_c0_g1_i1.p1  ORF type:complete len:364 (-),score=51.72 TRINITY_DN8382_c0_g1_i1:69-1115(-)
MKHISFMNLSTPLTQQFRCHDARSMRRMRRFKRQHSLLEPQDALQYRRVNMQAARKVGLVPPHELDIDLEGSDNVFSADRPPEDRTLTRYKALCEFDRFVCDLEDNGIEVTLYPLERGSQGYDAVFMNDWVSTHDEDGRFMVIYPLKCPVRRVERCERTIERLRKSYPRVIDLTEHENHGMYLESCGSLVLDRVNKIAYLAESERGHRNVAYLWGEKLGYTVIAFGTSFLDKPLYHTDVMMSIGSNWAVICEDIITNSEEKNIVLNTLMESGREIISITPDQMSKYCANIVELQGNDQIISMSERAYHSFTKEQLRRLSSHGRIVSSNIKTIEDIGGGSTRSMITELF